MESDFVQLIKNNITYTHQNNNFNSDDKCNCLEKIQCMNNYFSSSDPYLRFKKSLSFYIQEFKYNKKNNCVHKWNTVDGTKLIEDIYLNYND